MHKGLKKKEKKFIWENEYRSLQNYIFGVVIKKKECLNCTNLKSISYLRKFEDFLIERLT